MVVGGGKEFHQDLAYDSHTGFLLVADGDQVKFMDHIAAHFFELTVADAASFQEGDHPLFPDLVLPVYDALFQFVGAHPVYALHKDVSEYRSVDDALDQRKRKLETGIALKAA